MRAPSRSDVTAAARRGRIRARAATTACSRRTPRTRSTTAPTTTTGSLPQTGDVRQLRVRLNKGEIERDEYQRERRRKGAGSNRESAPDVQSPAQVMHVARLRLKRVTCTANPLSDRFALIAAPDTIDFPLLIVLLLLSCMAVSAVGSGVTLRRFLRI